METECWPMFSIKGVPVSRAIAGRLLKLHPRVFEYRLALHKHLRVSVAFTVYE